MQSASVISCVLDIVLHFWTINSKWWHLTIMDVQCNRPYVGSSVLNVDFFFFAKRLESLNDDVVILRGS